MTLIDRLWEQAEPVVFISKAEFVKNLEGWDIRPLEIEGDLAFIVMTKGPAFHFQSLGTGHTVTRQIIRRCLQPLIAAHGYATTRTPKDDARQHRFNLILGFKAVGEDDYDIHYRIEKLRGA